MSVHKLLRFSDHLLYLLCVSASVDEIAVYKDYLKIVQFSLESYTVAIRQWQVKTSTHKHRTAEIRSVMVNKTK